MGLIRKKPDWEIDAFRRHWIGPHDNLAKQLKGLRGYVQNHVIGHEQGAITLPRGPDEHDGFPELWFDDDDAMLAAVADLRPRLGADEAYFLGDLRILVAEQQDVPSLDDRRAFKYVAPINVRLTCRLTPFRSH